MDLIDILRKKRPNLSESSLKTYKSILSNIYRRCYPDAEAIDLKNFNDHDCVLKALKDVPFSKRKTTLSALVVLTENPEYSKLMGEDIKKYNEEKGDQKATGKFEDMPSMTDVEEIFKRLESDAKHILKNDRHSMQDLQKAQNYVLLALTGGIFQAPRRSLDWVMKFRGYDAENDNYVDLKAKRFVFNVFKTKKEKGTQSIEISKPLLAILKKWVTVIPDDVDYLLFDAKKNKITPSQITHRLNKIFNKNVSTSMLRHIYLTSKFANVNLKELQDTSNAMGNSPMQALEYVKR